LSRPRANPGQIYSASKKMRKLTDFIKQRSAEGAVCNPKIVVLKGGARECTTCKAKASTAKTIMLCARTGRLPGVKA
jgi:hypothetical protein